MKVQAHSKFILFLLISLVSQALLAQQPSTVPPTTPPGNVPQSAPPPGTQDDRQIPDTGSSRNAPASQSSSGANQATAAQPGTTRSSFGEKAAMKAEAAMKLGELAESNSVNREIRDLGKMMVDDHQDAFGKLTSFLRDSGVNMTNQVDAGDQAVYERLAKLSGDAFDREFLAQVVHDLQQAVSDYQGASTAADKNWSALAAQYLPVLQKELEKAEMISQSRVKPQATPIITRPRRPTWA